MVLLVTAPSVHALDQPPADSATVDAAAAQARARVAFQRGVVAAQRRDFERAASAFGEALSLRPAPSVEYNLAAALYELGRHREAYNHLSRVLADATLSSEVRDSALALERGVRPRVAVLRIAAHAEDGPIALSVDGRPEPPAPWARGLAVEPGSHRVRVDDRAGHAVERNVEALDGSISILDLHVVSLPSALAAAPNVAARGPALAPRPASEQARDGPPRHRSWKLWTAVGAGLVAGAAVAVAISLAGRSSQHASQNDASNLTPGVLTW